ncbi:acyltransferase family protein [Sphingomonas bacterium]|uniref:acyltransferase family protein n=1 Tax=Sphingomonas bacterium TaxID=1895847 RepID=UPI001576049A|nr:acyltransferase [Sphingomonas bacterium]
MQQDKRERLQAFDMAKGFAIVLVVYGHGLRGLVEAHAIGPMSPLLVSDYIIYTFHMPIFFFMSGWLFHSAGKLAYPFWRSRMLTIAYPYLVWSLLQAGVQMALAGSGLVNSTIPVARVLAIGWSPILIFWFLYALFFCNILAFYLYRVRPEILVVGGLLMFAIAAWLHAEVFGDIGYGFLYFALGLLARSRGWVERLPRTGGPAALLVLMFLAVAFTCHAVGVPERWPFPAALLGIAATLSCCFVIEDRAPRNVVTRLLATFGCYSMGIFVMHALMLGFVRAVMLHVLHVTNPALILPAAVVTGVLLPISVQAVLVRVGLNNWAGLPFSAAQRRRDVARPIVLLRDTA